MVRCPLLKLLVVRFLHHVLLHAVHAPLNERDDIDRVWEQRRRTALVYPSAHKPFIRASRPRAIAHLLAAADARWEPGRCRGVARPLTNHGVEREAALAFYPAPVRTERDEEANDIAEDTATDGVTRALCLATRRRHPALAT